MSLQARLRCNLKVLLIAAACLLLATWLYWPGLSGAFMLDDLQNIISLQSDLSWSGVFYGFTHNESGLLGRSVSVMSFYFSQWQFGASAWGYKFHNLLIHLINGLLLARLFCLLLPIMDRKLDRDKVLIIAGLSAALWLLHPLLVSTVLYAVQRMTQLAVLFTLLALLCYVKFRCMQQQCWVWYWRAWLLFPFLMLLALLSKETGVLIPLYILIIEVTVFRAGVDFFRKNRHQMIFLLVFVGLPILLGSIVLLAKFSSFTDYSSRSFTLAERLLTQLHVVAFYIKMIFLPRLRGMSLYHDDFTVTHGLDIGTAVLLVLLLAGIASVWMLRHKLPVLAFGLGWFLVSHVLESTLLPLELVFEHRNYLAAAGLLLIPVYLIFTIELLKPARIVCGLFLLIFAFMTHSRALEWGDENLSLAVAVAEHPQSPRARNALANYLMTAGQLDMALEQLEIASELNIKDPGSTLHLLGTKCVNGIADRAAYERALAQLGTYPLTVYALNALDNLIEFMSKDKCTLLTLDDFGKLIDTAMGLEKNSSIPLYKAYMLRFHGIHSLMTGRYAQGVIDFRMAHEYTGQISYLAELVQFQIELGMLADAAETVVVMEAQNARRFGLDSHQVDIIKSKLAEAQ